MLQVDNCNEFRVARKLLMCTVQSETHSAHFVEYLAYSAAEAVQFF